MSTEGKGFFLEMEQGSTFFLKAKDKYSIDISILCENNFGFMLDLNFILQLTLNI